MAKIPFDIKFRPQIEAGKYKVVTRSGNSVRIICWDKVGKYPIIFLAKSDKGSFENVLTCSRSGRIGVNDCNGDLFLITPEQELSEFESKVKHIVDNLTNNITYRNVMKERFNRGDEDEQIKEYASELLNLARKQLIEEHYTSDPRKTDLYKLGKAEALKDLPRWVKVDEGVLLDKYSKYLLYSNGVYYYCCGSTITRDGYMLLVDNLEKLPKEETK